MVNSHTNFKAPFHFSAHHLYSACTIKSLQSWTSFIFWPSSTTHRQVGPGENRGSVHAGSYNFFFNYFVCLCKQLFPLTQENYTIHK
jgi:hypothetical protein